MSMPGLQCGSSISLLSRSDVRYEGILLPSDFRKTFALAKVRSYGTENRICDLFLPPLNEVYEVVVFKAADIKDYKVIDTPKLPMLSDDVFYDPAIIVAKIDPFNNYELHYSLLLVMEHLQYLMASDLQLTQKFQEVFKAVQEQTLQLEDQKVRMDWLSGMIDEFVRKPSPESGGSSVTTREHSKTREERSENLEEESQVDAGRVQDKNCFRGRGGGSSFSDTYACTRCSNASPARRSV